MTWIFEYLLLFFLLKRLQEAQREEQWKEVAYMMRVISVGRLHMVAVRKS